MLRFSRGNILPTSRGAEARPVRAGPSPPKGLKARPEDRTALLRAFAEGGADRLAAGAGGRGADLNLVGAAVAVAVVIRAAAHRAGNPLLVLGFVGLLPFILFFPFLSVKKCRSLPAGGKARLYFRKRLSRRKTGNRRRADLGFCRAAEYRVRFPARAVRLAEGGIVLFFVFVPLLSACS